MVIAVGMLAAVAACGGSAPAEPAPIRVVPALNVALARQPAATDRQLHLRVAMSALSDSARPVDRVDVQRDAGQVRLRVWVRERTPHADEPVSNSAVVREHVVDLDQPVGDATAVDASTEPPRPVPVTTA